MMKGKGIGSRNTKVAYGNEKVISEAKQSGGTATGADTSPYSSAKPGGKSGSDKHPLSSAAKK